MKHYGNAISFAAYENGERFLGLTQVKLPSIKYITDSMEGAGLAGKIDIPTQGMTDAMEIELNWHTMNKKHMDLAGMQSHKLEFRSVQQTVDAKTDDLGVEGARIVVRTLPKEVDLGKLVTAAKGDATDKLEITYLLIEIDGTKMVEIDKLNFKCYVAGTDWLANVRSLLGM